MNYKNIVGTIGVATLLSSGMAIESNAYQPVQYYAVTRGDIPVKTYETDSESKFKGYVYPDMVVPVYDITVNGWCKILSNGEECWVRRDEMQNVAQLNKQNYYVVGMDKVDVYDRIVVQDTVVKTVKKGEKIVSCGDSIYLFDDKGNVEDEYLRVEDASDEWNFYYAPKRYFEKSKGLEEKDGVVNKSTKMYYAPLSNAISTGTISGGSKVKIIGLSGSYAKVKYGNDIVYINKTDVEEGTGFESRYMYIDRNKVEKVDVYSQPTSNSKKLGNAYSDYARYVTNVIDGYAEITYMGKTGYIKYDLLREDRITENKYAAKDLKVKKESGSSDVIGEVKKNTKVTVLGYCNDWARIESGNMTGYVSKIDLRDSSVDFKEKYMYVDRNKTEKVDVYSKPSSSSSKLGSAYSDYARYVTDVINGYAEVEYMGKTGYIKYDLLREDRITEEKYIKNSVDVKKESGGTAVVGRVTKGDKAVVLGYCKDLARVEVGNVTGYIPSSELVNDKPSDFKEKYMYVDRNKTEKVDVYSKPSSSSSKLGIAYSDYARYVTNVINGYAEVEYMGKTGYIKYDLLRDNRITESKYLLSNVDVKKESGGTAVVGRVTKGDKAVVLGYCKDLARVEVGNITGYVPSSLLSDSKPTDFKARHMYIDRNKTDKVDVYSKPSSSSSKLGSAYSDYARYVTDVINGYAEVEYMGKTGYIKYDLLRDNRITDTMYLKESAQVKKESGKDTVVGTVSKGQEVTVLGYCNDLARIETPNMTGYVLASKLSKDKLIHLDSMNIVSPTVKTRYVTIDKSSVYSDTAMKNPVGFLDRGDTVEYMEAVSSNVVKLKINNSLTAYMRTSDVSHKNPLAKNTTSTVSKQLSITHDEYVDGQVGKPYANIEDVKYYSNPKNYSMSNGDEKYQFLKIDTFRNINVYELNEYLNGLTVQSGKVAIFKNQAQAFVDAARKNNIDPIYLVAHTMLETGYGSSTLAQGVVVTQDAAGNEVKPTKVHNLFGIGAVDSDAVGQGSKVAYAMGWTSIPKAIEGAAKWIATGVDEKPEVGLKASPGYIHSEKFTEQYNLYSMRWDYVAGWHQYATDPGWALKISRLMNKISYLYEGANLVFENIKYKESPKVEILEDTEYCEVTKKSTLRSGPSGKFRKIGEIEEGSIVEVGGFTDNYALIKCDEKEFYIEKSSLEVASSNSEIKAIITEIEKNEINEDEIGIKE